MDKIAEFIASLFLGVKVSSKVGILIIILALLIFGFLQYERLSGHFYLTRLESKVSVLKDLPINFFSRFRESPRTLAFIQECG